MDVTPAKIFPRTTITKGSGHKRNPVTLEHGNGISGSGGMWHPSNPASIRHKERPVAISLVKNAYKWIFKLL